MTKKKKQSNLCLIPNSSLFSVHFFLFKIFRELLQSHLNSPKNPIQFYRQRCRGDKPLVNFFFHSFKLMIQLRPNFWIKLIWILDDSLINLCCFFFINRCSIIIHWIGGKWNSINHINIIFILWMNLVTLGAVHCLWKWELVTCYLGLTAIRNLLATLSNIVNWVYESRSQ